MRSHKRFEPSLASWTAALTAVAICGFQPAAGQSLQQTAKILVIHEIVGEDTVEVGDVETYRARTNVTRDVEFRWTSNGLTSLGNPIVHRFQTPGRYEIVVTARNPVSAASDTFTVTVLGPEPPRVAADSPGDAPSDAPADGSANPSDAATGTGAAGAGAEVASSEPAESGFVRGTGGQVNQSGQGYTWIIATYFQRPSAIALANSYRASGYKASVIADNSGQGSEVYRVILGEFGTERSAMRAKQHLIRAGHKNPILLELGQRG